MELAVRGLVPSMEVPSLRGTFQQSRMPHNA
jgi:hypothetical protein